MSNETVSSKDKHSCTSHSNLLSHVPAHLQISVLHVDKSIIVIDKPCNLRSVPGHARSPPPDALTRSKKRPRISQDTTQQLNSPFSHRRTAQEAWVEAIRTFEKNMGENEHDMCETNEQLIQSCLMNLAKTNNLSSIPRKWKTFWRYLQRNQHRLGIDAKQLDEATAKQIYKRIEERQRPLLNLPEPTPHEESAWGQLVLMGYSDKTETKKSTDEKGLFVVHRLDCETSGVMTFARTELAASVLSQAWRERNQVSKLYLARVSSWPPFEEEKLTEGCIKLPLAPSQERIKWEVSTNGKPSTTLWKVRSSNQGKIVLELTPVTGRTHQLRIHCATVGSGICGDSLYGKDPIEWNADNGGSGTTLELHAHQLLFPHPETGKVVGFVSKPPLNREYDVAN